jgi:hypothetical protein
MMIAPPYAVELLQGLDRIAARLWSLKRINPAEIRDWLFSTRRVARLRCSDVSGPPHGLSKPAS